MRMESPTGLGYAFRLGIAGNAGDLETHHNTEVHPCFAVTVETN